MENNNQQNFIDQLNKSWNAEPQTNKKEVSSAQVTKTTKTAKLHIKELA